MRAQIAYGRGRLTVALPAGARALRCRPVAPVADPAAAVLRALREPIGAPPLRQLAAGRRSACIVVSDVTRPVPCRTLLPPLLAELEGAVAQVELLVATGTHRASTPAEKREMIGADVSTVSKHLALLKQAGVVIDERRGQQVFYRLRVPCILNFFGCVEAVLEEVGRCDVVEVS